MQDTVRRGSDLAVRFGCSVQQIDFARPAVQLEAGETVAADLALGTDGARSTCCEALLGHADPLRPSGKLIYRVCIDIDGMSPHPEVADLIHPPRIHIWLGPAAHVVCYGLKGVFNVVISQPEDDKGISFDVQKGDLDKLRQSFQTWEPRLRKLLELAMKRSAGHYPRAGRLNPGCALAVTSRSWATQQLTRPSRSCQPPSPSSWSEKEDEASCQLTDDRAQDAAMAFDSALVLSSLLCSTSSTAQFTALLRVYKRARFPRTSKVDELSRATLDYLEMPEGPEQVERDRPLRDVGRARVRCLHWWIRRSNLGSGFLTRGPMRSSCGVSTWWRTKPWN